MPFSACSQLPQQVGLENSCVEGVGGEQEASGGEWQWWEPVGADGVGEDKSS